MWVHRRTIEKEYIRPLKTSQIVLVFFVGKKNLISDIVENIYTKKVFTKLDLQWEYNNIWIKEEDK